MPENDRRKRFKNPHPPVQVPPVKERVKAAGASKPAPSASRYMELLKDDLVKEAADRGLSTEGTKQDIVDRLVADDRK